MNQFNFKVSIDNENFNNYLEEPKLILNAIEHLQSTQLIKNFENIDITIEHYNEPRHTNLSSIALALNDTQVLKIIENLINRPIGEIEIVEGWKRYGDKEFSKSMNTIKFKHEEDFSLLNYKLAGNEKSNTKLAQNYSEIILDRIKENKNKLNTAFVRIEQDGYTKDLLTFIHQKVDSYNLTCILFELKDKLDFKELMTKFKEEYEKSYLSQLASLYENGLIKVEDITEKEFIYIIRNFAPLFQMLLKDGLDVNKFAINDILAHASDISIASLLVQSNNNTQNEVMNEDKALITLSAKKVDVPTFEYYATTVYKKLLENPNFTASVIKKLISNGSDAKFHDNPIITEQSWEKIIYLKNKFNANIKDKDMLALINFETGSTKEDEKMKFCYDEKIILATTSFFTKTVSSRTVKTLNQLNKKYPNWLGAHEANYILKQGSTVQLLEFVANKLKKELFQEFNPYHKPYFSFSRKADLITIRQTYKELFNKTIDINEKTSAGNTLINEYLNSYQDKGKYDEKVSIHDVLNLSKTEVIDASAIDSKGNNPLYGIYINNRVSFDYEKIKRLELVKKMEHVDINHQNFEGNTVFHSIIKHFGYDNAAYKIKEAIKELLNLFKFDPSIKNNNGKTVIDLLSETKTTQPFIVDFEKILLENGVNQEVNLQTNKKIKI